MMNFSTRFKKVVPLLFLCGILFPGCNKTAAADPNALDKDTSYAFGMFAASQMGLGGIIFDYTAFAEGFRDFNEAKETRLTQDQAWDKIIAAITRIEAQEEEEMWLEGEQNREAGEAYLAENGRRSGVITTRSGLQYEVITEGTGAKPGPQDVVRVEYEGFLIDGTLFDNSARHGGQIEFGLYEVIRGWTEGIQLMSEGSVYRFVIPSDLAYGPSGAGSIPPFATLIFEVELLAVVK